MAAKKETRQTLREMNRWHRQGPQKAFRDIELEDFGAKLGKVDFFIKAGLDQIPIVDDEEASKRIKLEGYAIISVLSKKLISWSQ